jgi:hypothetical protein
MKTLKIYSFVFTVLFSLAFLSLQNSFAQCNLVAIDSDGNIMNTSVISCDFPVYVSTGNAEVDDQDFAAQEANYVNNHAGDRRTFAEAIINAGAYYIEIHQADFDAMGEGRKNAIQANPNRFHIIQD